MLDDSNDSGRAGELLYKKVQHFEVVQTPRTTASPHDVINPLDAMCTVVCADVPCR